MSATWSLRNLALAFAGYCVGFLVSGIIGLLFLHGLETSARELLPFHLAFDFLFGLTIGGGGRRSDSGVIGPVALWVLAFPAGYYLVTEPLLKLLLSGSYTGNSSSPLFEFVVFGMLALAAGICANTVLRLLARRRDASS